MTHLPQVYSLDGKPSGPNCGGLYPSAIKGCREYFASDIVGAVDIGVDGRASFNAVPAAISAPSEAGLALLFGSLLRVVGGQHIPIEKAGFAGVALFGDHHSDANGLRLVR